MVRYVFFFLVFLVIVTLIYAIIKGIISMDSSRKRNDKKISSVSDELLKLQNLKEEGILTEEEFQHMKKKLLK